MLVSGTGSILQAMLEAGIEPALVAADRDCLALERAAEAGIAAELVERDTFSTAFDRDAYSARMAKVLEAYGIDLVAMAGFGTVFSEPMHKRFGGRIINTHPALLPSFKGWHAVEAALDYGVKVTGCTVHVAGLAVDTGPIIAQVAVPVLDDDTVETLHERIKEVERDLYPETLKKIISSGVVPGSERNSP